MEKQRQFQVLLLPHSRIKPTSSLNQMSVEDEVRPASSGIHPTVNEKAKGGAHRGRWQHGRHFSHSSTISGYRFFTYPQSIESHYFWGFFVQATLLPHCLIGRIWKPIAINCHQGWTWTISSLSSHSTAIIVRYKIKRKTTQIGISFI